MSAAMFSTTSDNILEHVKAKINSLEFFAEVMLESAETKEEKIQISQRFKAEIDEIQTAVERQAHFDDIASLIIKDYNPKK